MAPLFIAFWGIWVIWSFPYTPLSVSPDLQLPCNLDALTCPSAHQLCFTRVPKSTIPASHPTLPDPMGTHYPTLVPYIYTPGCTHLKVKPTWLNCAILHVELCMSNVQRSGSSLFVLDVAKTNQHMCTAAFMKWGAQAVLLKLLFSLTLCSPSSPTHTEPSLPLFLYPFLQWPT